VLLLTIFLSLMYIAPLFSQSSGENAEGATQEETGTSEQEGSSDGSSEESGERILKGFTPGIIFNTSNLLMDISGYQSGFGMKFRGNSFSLRTLLSLGYDSSTEVLDATLGAALEKPFFTGRVTPFWGFSVEGGYVEDEGDMFDSTTLSAKVAALLGVEVYILDFLSVFAEYELGASVSRVEVDQDAGGGSDSTNHAFGTGLGNDASIGIVIYLEKHEIASGEEAAEVSTESEDTGE
jgi:hypothetical protein